MSYENFSKKQWFLLLFYCIVNTISTSLVSIHAPFYPMVASNKGATASQYGIVFGAFYLTIFFSSPLYGKLIPLLGATFVCSLGIFITGVTSILFGLLDMINETNMFIGLSIVIRIVEGIGCTAFRTASLCIISNEFSDNIDSAFALYQSSFNVGLILGAPVGGALFDLGGFILPFLEVGSLLLCSAIAMACIPRSFYKKDYVELKSDISYWDLLKLPFVVMGLLIVFGAYFCAALVLIFLEPHLESLELSPSTIGLLLVLNGLSVVVSSPFWGKLCESYISPHYVWSIGVILNILSLQLFGPAPYFPIKLNIYICIASLITNGFAETAQTVSAFSGITKEVANAGIPLDLATNGLISTLYTSSLALGIFASPTIGGFLYDSIGIPWGSHVYLAFQLMLGLGTVVLVLPKKRREKTERLDEERRKICKLNLVSSYKSFNFKE